MAGQLKGKTDILILPGNSSSVEILETNWNTVRSKMLEWLSSSSQ